MKHSKTLEYITILLYPFVLVIVYGNLRGETDAFTAIFNLIAVVFMTPTVFDIFKKD